MRNQGSVHCGGGLLRAQHLWFTEPSFPSVEKRTQPFLLLNYKIHLIMGYEVWILSLSIQIFITWPEYSRIDKIGKLNFTVPVKTEVIPVWIHDIFQAINVTLLPATGKLSFIWFLFASFPDILCGVYIWMLGFQDGGTSFLFKNNFLFSSCSILRGGNFLCKHAGLKL